MILGLAPMDGITDLPYRTIVKQVFDTYNTDHKLRMRTEFMNADGYMINPSKLIKHLVHHTQETPLVAQIYGGNEDTLVKTAIDIQKKYPTFAGVELNIGCPSPKVMACGGGSGMMKDKKRCLEIIKHISKSIDMPFSIKVRAGLTQDDKHAQYHMLIDASQYCHTISVHGRTFKQGHSGDVDREMIYRLKKEIGNSCHIIGNGGIHSYEDAMNHVHNLDGVMIAQAAIANPRIFVPHEPSLDERFAIINQHLDLMMAYEYWFNHTLNDNQEDISGTKQLILNKEALHKIKKMDDDDSIIDVPDIDFHDYIFPFPTLKQLEEIQKQLMSHPELVEGYKSPIEFRKYLFNYVKGIPGSKEFKQDVARIKDYHALKTAIKNFFAIL